VSVTWHLNLDPKYSGECHLSWPALWLPQRLVVFGYDSSWKKWLPRAHCNSGGSRNAAAFLCSDLAMNYGQILYVDAGYEMGM